MKEIIERYPRLQTTLWRGRDAEGSLRYEVTSDASDGTAVEPAYVSYPSRASALRAAAWAHRAAAEQEG